MSINGEDAEKIYESFLEKDWGDGLPIIPPTEERVKRMLAFTDQKPDDSLGSVPPMDGEATVENIAVNAVMAGCKPEYFPVVLTAVACAIDRGVDLRSVISTTGLTWPITIVHGPIAKELSINAGWGIMGGGPRYRANVTIGRALTMCITNIGGAIPGVTEKKPSANPLRSGICFAENDASPWDLLHVDRGFSKETTAVTVGGASLPGRMPLHGCVYCKPSKIELEIIAKHLANDFAYDYPIKGLAGRGTTLILFEPWHAQQFCNDGMTKHDVKRFIYEEARVSLLETPMAKVLPKESVDILLPDLPSWLRSDYTNAPIARSIEDIFIVVAGAEVDEWSEVYMRIRRTLVTKPIALIDGTPVKSVYDFVSK